jgi:hypothetical protein
VSAAPGWSQGRRSRGPVAIRLEPPRWRAAPSRVPFATATRARTRGGSRGEKCDAEKSAMSPNENVWFWADRVPCYGHVSFFPRGSSRGPAWEGSRSIVNDRKFVQQQPSRHRARGDLYVRAPRRRPGRSLASHLIFAACCANRGTVGIARCWQLPDCRQRLPVVS